MYLHQDFCFYEVYRTIMEFKQATGYGPKHQTKHGMINYLRYTIFFYKNIVYKEKEKLKLALKLGTLVVSSFIKNYLICKALSKNDVLKKQNT